MFGTSGIRGRVGDEVTASLALSVGRALASEGYDRVVVGRDARDSGEFLASTLRAGLRECGSDVVDVGRASTPTVARAVGAQGADAGASVTASHNPATDNGIKLWNPDGRAFDADQRAAVTEAVEGGRFDLSRWDELGGRTRWAGAVERHRTAVVDAVGDVDGVDGLRVVVDVGNGVGGVTADALVDLGAAVETLNAQPDGRFPGRPSEPTAETCASLRAHVAATDADLGIAHDGDADRTMAVDETGDFLPGDVLMALFALATVEEGDRIVAPVNTSLAVDDALAVRNATVLRTRVGDVHVAERLRESGAAFGGEPSGAWIWPDESMCPDGPLAAVRLAGIVASGEPLSTQAASVAQYPIRRESVEVAGKDAVMDRVRALVAERYDEDGVNHLDGVRVDVDGGWFLVRASGTQPLVRLTAEARDAERCETLLAEAREILERSV
jgi:phosphoglucosamine mutase